jgi:hypothetical protein
MKKICVIHGPGGGTGSTIIRRVKAETRVPFTRTA